MKLLLGMVGLETADGIITHLLVRSGLVSEGNPLVAPLVGDGSFIILKVTGALACAVALWWVYRRLPRLGLAAAAAVTIFYVAVLGWNASVLLAV